MEDNKQTSEYLQYAAAKKLMRELVKVFLSLSGAKPKGDLENCFRRFSTHPASRSLNERVGTSAARAMTMMLSDMRAGVSRMREGLREMKEYEPVKQAAHDATIKARSMADGIPKRSTVRFTITFAHDYKSKFAARDHREIVIGASWMRRVMERGIADVSDGTSQYFIAKAAPIASHHLRDLRMDGYAVVAYSFKGSVRYHDGYVVTTQGENQIKAFGRTLDAAVKLAQRRAVRAVISAMDGA